MSVSITLSAAEAVVLFVVLNLAIGLLNAIANDLWAWLRRRLSRSR